MRRRLLLLVAVAAVAGCGGGGAPKADKPPPQQLPQRQATVPAFPDVPPGVILGSFVQAVRDGDADRIWPLLARATQRRLGPTLADFRGRSIGEVARRVGSFLDYRVILQEPITLDFAVAALAGERRAGPLGSREFGAFASAMQVEDGRWRVMLPGPITIRILRPEPDEDVEKRTQLAAEVSADGPLQEAGLWFDGLAFSPRGGGTDPAHLTMFGEAPQPLVRGRHTVVAFASTRRNAAAVAWVFTVSVAGRPTNEPVPGRLGGP